MLMPDDELRQITGQAYLHKGSNDKETEAFHLDATITYSTLIKADNATGGRFLVMGDVDGGLHIWDAQ